MTCLLRTRDSRPTLSPELRITGSWIYGLFDFWGACHYIGQTRNPEKREYVHQKVFGPHLSLMVIRHCLEMEAARLENQVIEAYKRRGMAGLNKAKPQSYPSCPTTPIYCPNVDQWFNSLSQAAAYFGCSAVTIKRYLTKVVDNPNSCFHKLDYNLPHRD